jgi:transcriptional regulator with XRE-family HTH domain
MTFNEYLKENKLSVAKFAEISQIPIPTITKYKYSERIPRPDFMRKIAVATNYQVLPNDWHKDLLELKRVVL